MRLVDAIHAALGNVEIISTLFVCSIYFLLLLVTRWVIVARELRRTLRADIDEALADLHGLPPNDRMDVLRKTTRDLLEKAKGMLAPEHTRFGYKLFWGGATELAAMADLRSAQVMMIDGWPSARVEARLQTVMDHLESEADAKHLLAEMKDIARKLKTDGHDPEAQSLARGLLERVLRTLWFAGVEETGETITKHNKSVWITAVSLLFCMTLASVFGRADLLLAGAAGGFLSLLHRIRGTEGLSSKADHYWTSLFMSPTLGALAGFWGTKLASLLALDGLLGQKLLDPASSQAIAVAFLCGFSERLFEALASSGSKGATDEKKEPKPSAAENSKPG